MEPLVESFWKACIGIVELQIFQRFSHRIGPLGVFTFFLNVFF
jgi:hypothetical protein